PAATSPAASSSEICDRSGCSDAERCISARVGSCWQLGGAPRQLTKLATKRPAGCGSRGRRRRLLQADTSSRTLVVAARILERRSALVATSSWPELGLQRHRAEKRGPTWGRPAGPTHYAPPPPQPDAARAGSSAVDHPDEALCAPAAVSPAARATARPACCRPSLRPVEICGPLPRHREYRPGSIFACLSSTAASLLGFRRPRDDRRIEKLVPARATHDLLLIGVLAMLDWKREKKKVLPEPLKIAPVSPASAYPSAGGADEAMKMMNAAPVIAVPAQAGCPTARTTNLTCHEADALLLPEPAPPEAGVFCCSDCRKGRRTMTTASGIDDDDDHHALLENINTIGNTSAAPSAPAVLAFVLGRPGSSAWVKLFKSVCCKRRTTSRPFGHRRQSRAPQSTTQERRRGRRSGSSAKMPPATSTSSP
uniref:Protein-serine/threonine phosphatase n=1 Tax=Macrostomum lignano TaxID=282301 RepID=A0A1I8FBD8_9PLAT